MELQNLKESWQKAGEAFRSEADLQKMTRITHHPSIKKIRTKLIIETIGLVLLLFVYYDWFDGNKKPFSANVLLVSSLLLYILTDVIGYISIISPVRGINLKLSLQNYLVLIKRLSVLSLMVSFVYAISIIIFFTSIINFTKEKKLILLFFTVILFQIIFWSHRIWSKWIKKLKQQIRNFDLDKE